MSQPAEPSARTETDPGRDAEQQPPPRPHAILRYTTLRLALFLAALALLWLVRIRDGVLLVAIALVLSGLASYLLLAHHRDAMSAQLHAAQERRRARRVAKVSREDVDES